jgi:hypothetical protein
MKLKILNFGGDLKNYYSVGFFKSQRKLFLFFLFNLLTLIPRSYHSLSNLNHLYPRILVTCLDIILNDKLSNFCPHFS